MESNDAKNKNMKSLLEMANGAILEKVDYEMVPIIRNIQDINTNATEERVLTLTIKLKPDDERQQINVKIFAKSKLASTNPIQTSLYLIGEGNKTQAVEMVPNIPGQISLDGSEQKDPPVLRLIKAEA